MFERTNMCEVFGTSRPELAVPPYDFVVPASTDDRAAHRTWGRSVGPVHGLDRPAGADLVFGAGGSAGSAPPGPVVAALRRTHGRGARVAGRCARANVAGRAGLLDSRRATTHRSDADALTARFPDDQVDPDVLYVGEDPVFTSAGFAAGLDLRLPLRRPDHGADVPANVAARRADPPRRDGSQARIVTPPMTSGPCPLALVLDRAGEHLERPAPVADPARPAGASPRRFARRFVDTVGATPLQWLLRQRLLHAQSLLESADDAVEGIARQSGSTSPDAMRTHFRRLIGMTPTRYRRPFRGQK